MFDKLLEKNKSLEYAIKQSQGSLNEDTLKAIVKELQICIKEKSHVLVPISNPEAENGENYMLRTTYNSEHKLYAIAFTNEEEITKGSETSTLLYDIDSILNIVLATEGLQGLVFNPWGDPFYMPKSVIQLARETPTEATENYIKENALLDTAIHFAVEQHAGQLRQGTKRPYILHPLETMNILASMKMDTPLMIAGVLFNILEETDATLNDIVITYGTDVASLISSHSEDRSKSWQDRKAAAIEDLKKASLRYKILVLAEHVSSLSNLYTDLEEYGPNFWNQLTESKEQLAWYYSKLQDALIELKDFSETTHVYWDMVSLYKAIFVTYHFDREAGMIYQISTNGEGYMITRAHPEWKPFTKAIPDTTVEISQYDAEKIEEAWNMLAQKEN